MKQVESLKKGIAQCKDLEEQEKLLEDAAIIDARLDNATNIESRYQNYAENTKVDDVVKLIHELKK